MSDIPGQGMSDNPPMSDIRTRIVAAMKERAERDTDWMLVDLADAVIAELGLREEVSQRGALIRPTSELVTVPLLKIHRWVTEWETTDE